MESIEMYKESMYYENFINNSLSNNRKLEVKNAQFMTLMKLEKGEKLPLLSLNKQIETIKTNILRAFDRYLKNKKLSTEDYVKLSTYRQYTEDSNTSSVFLDLCKKGLEITIKY